jgi:phage virion morphogenesis protein
MAGAFIEVEVKVSDQAVLDKLAALRRLGADLRPVFLEIGQHLDRSTRERWDRAEAPDGRKWAPLQPSTLARKKKNADKILVLNAHLRDTLAAQATADSLKFGSNRVYAAVHQFGAQKGAFGLFSIVRTRRQVPIPWGDIPARPFLGISADDRAEILAILADHLGSAP